MSKPGEIDAVQYSNSMRDEDKPIQKDAPRCLACGHVHGAVNVLIRCLEAEIVRLRAAT